MQQDDLRNTVREEQHALVLINPKKDRLGTEDVNNISNVPGLKIGTPKDRWTGKPRGGSVGRAKAFQQAGRWQAGTLGLEASCVEMVHVIILSEKNTK